MNSSNRQGLGQQLSYSSARIQSPILLVLWLGCLFVCGMIVLSSPLVGGVLSAFFLGLSIVECSARKVHFDLDDRLTVSTGGKIIVSVPVDSIQSISDNRQVDKAFIYVHHRSGTIAIPRQGKGSLGLFLAKIKGEGNSHSGMDLPSSLKRFRAKESDKFEPEEVFSVGARDDFGISKGSEIGTRKLLVFGAAMALWIVAGVIDDNDGLVAIAIMGIVCGLFYMVFRRGARRRLHKLWDGAGIVISPDGLALSQGDDKGVLQWKEVISAELSNHRVSFSTGIVENILVKIEGAELKINNVYAQSLSTIESEINQHIR